MTILKRKCDQIMPGDELEGQGDADAVGVFDDNDVDNDDDGDDIK